MTDPGVQCKYSKTCESIMCEHKGRHKESMRCADLNVYKHCGLRPDAECIDVGAKAESFTLTAGAT